MKIMQYLLLAFCLFLTSTSYSQEVSESILSYKGSFSPLFSKESSVLYVDFLKRYSIDSNDTSYVFVIDLQKDQLEETGVSLGATVFGSNLAFGSSKSYKLNKIRDNSVLGKEEFLEFYSCIKKVHSFISKQRKYGESSGDMVATCGTDNLLMGGEFVKSGNGGKTNYYFKVGENATYSMKRSQFIEIVKVLSKIKSDWETK
ncbi:MAG: hypothetical protein ACI9P5_002011 [Saprospiraceae bacterium]|jgi:hypothetical protein